MHSKLRRAILPLTALTCLVGLLLQSACLGTGRCDSLRTDLLHRRDTWAACDPSGGDDQCVVVSGDESDCTGVLKCAFAVNAANRGIAEDAVITNASDSPVCQAVCSTPTCGDNPVPVCDPVLKRCVVKVDLSGSGGVDQDAGTGEEPDTSTPIETKDAAAKDAAGG